MIGLIRHRIMINTLVALPAEMVCGNGTVSVSLSTALFQVIVITNIRIIRIG